MVITNLGSIIYPLSCLAQLVSDGLCYFGQEYTALLVAIVFIYVEYATKAEAFELILSRRHAIIS